jgi:hypothetical protein
MKMQRGNIIDTSSRQRNGARLAAVAAIVAAIVLIATGKSIVAQNPNPAPAPNPAQNPAPAASQPQQPTTPPLPNHRRVPRQLAVEKPSPSVPAPSPVQAPPPEPPKPDWPVNDKPAPAKVTWDNTGLTIEANNSSLDEILKEVATQTGAKLDGKVGDERVFGYFGPGSARDIIAQLLDGTAYNVVMIGDQGAGTPREIVLSNRPTGPAPNSARSTSEDEVEYEEPQQVMPPIPAVHNAFGSPGQPPEQNQPPSVEERRAEMEQRREQMQQQQQDQPPPQQPQTPPQ